MRIIAGRFKGHHLVEFKASHIRPTSDRVKESLFNIIREEVVEAKVLDLFSGTGNLGLEALSRGATEITFVEKDKKSIEILLTNIQKLKVQSDATVNAQDVFLFLKKYTGPSFDVIFADPPYTEELGHRIVQAVSVSKAFGDSSLLVIESGRRERLDLDYPDLARIDQRTFGDTNMSFYRKRIEL